MTAYAAQSITSPSAPRRVPTGAGVNEASFLAALDGDFDMAPGFPLGLNNCETGDTSFRVHRV